MVATALFNCMFYPVMLLYWIFSPFRLFFLDFWWDSWSQFILFALSRREGKRESAMLKFSLFFWNSIRNGHMSLVIKAKHRVYITLDSFSDLFQTMQQPNGRKINEKDYESKEEHKQSECVEEKSRKKKFVILQSCSRMQTVLVSFSFCVSRRRRLDQSKQYVFLEKICK